MNGNNIELYINGRFHKYYKFYQIYDYCFLGFNNNDPVDYIRFDSAEIEDGQVRLCQIPKDVYRITVTTEDGDSFTYDSVEADSFIDALDDLNDKRLLDATVKKLTMEFVEGAV